MNQSTVIKPVVNGGQKQGQVAPPMERLINHFQQAMSLVDDVVVKNYLTKLSGLEIIPYDEDSKSNKVRLFKITQMVYAKDENAAHKFSTAFNAISELGCSIFILIDGDGRNTDFYFGIKVNVDDRYPEPLIKTAKQILAGQFPGVKTDIDEVPRKVSQNAEFLENIKAESVAAVSCVANIRNENAAENETAGIKYIQGLEKLALAMKGKQYTAVILAEKADSNELAEIRRGYENIYTQLSAFAQNQITYSENYSDSFSFAHTRGTSHGTSESTNKSYSTGNSQSNTKSNSVSKGTTSSEGTSNSKTKSAMLGKALGITAAGLGILAAPLTGGASLAVAVGLGAMQTVSSLTSGNSTTTETTTSTAKNNNASQSQSDSSSVSTNKTTGSTKETNSSQNVSNTDTNGYTLGTSQNSMYTLQNKTVVNLLERIDLQLERLAEFESQGLFKCAAYFMSDNSSDAEIAASVYKALMMGENSGVEVSALNTWGSEDKYTLRHLKKYITGFNHPIFKLTNEIAVTPSSFVSGNELSYQMALPRNSVCGFPVVRHADFGKEVVSFRDNNKSGYIELGTVFNMGAKLDTPVRLDRDSLTMHTFITGSTGAGKSNSVYKILEELKKPFLIIEPAKGEYKKHLYKKFPTMSVYGTNPQITPLLRINPFRFPRGIHVLEHLDRLVELFNVCWPMYAAMPALLKDAMERAYKSAGWDLSLSENIRGEFFPNFVDLLAQIEKVIDESKYSAESKGDYTGALCTRVRSLTTGLNGLIFNDDDLSDEELFKNKVIVDLSRIGSTETKSLIMGLLIIKLNEYYIGLGETKDELSHITVLEEAHNLLKRTSTEQTSESSNLLGKSVELLTNSIAEMRAYGEGFIIADQSPGLLDISVIRNTNTKIIHRLPEQGDRELVGYAAGLNDEQIEELSKLELGVAAVYQNDWIEPVLAKVNEFERNKSDVNYLKNAENESSAKIDLFFRCAIGENVSFDVSEKRAIVKWINGLSVRSEAKYNSYQLVEGKTLAKYQRRSLLHEILEVNRLWEYLRLPNEDEIIPSISDCISTKFKLGQNNDVSQKLAIVALEIILPYLHEGDKAKTRIERIIPTRSGII